VEGVEGFELRESPDMLFMPNAIDVKVKKTALDLVSDGVILR